MTPERLDAEPMTDPEGEGLADDLIGSDPSPPDVRRFDEKGRRLTPAPPPATSPATLEPDEPA